MPLSAQARRRQTLDEIDGLIAEFDRWFADATREQYQTQLNAIRSEVLGAAGIIRTDAQNLSTTVPVGDVYGRCASIEKQLMWLRRVWYFFRDKFDQRKDPRYMATLRAADEVVWSCYRPFFTAAASQRIPEPAPLPYIETEYSPAAVRRDQQQILGAKDKEFALVRNAFASLPVPILKLPVSVIGNPWMLVLVGHEVGHVVQPLVDPPDDFAMTFRKAVMSAVDPGQADVWGRWSIEVFADWYSIVTMGSDAVWTMAQCETADPATLCQRRTAYPAPLVRLELMAALADGLGFPGTGVLEALNIARPTEGTFPEADADRRAVPAVVKAILGLAACAGLAEQVGLNPADFETEGLVDQWADHLLGSAPPVSNKPNSARRAAAGAARAWDVAVFIETPPDVETLEALRQRAVTAMKNAAAPGTRSSSAAAESPAPGRKLHELLRQTAESGEPIDA